MRCRLISLLVWALSPPASWFEYVWHLVGPILLMAGTIR
jgi:hypothetical protein